MEETAVELACHICEETMSDLYKWYQSGDDIWCHSCIAEHLVSTALFFNDIELIEAE